MLEWWTEMTPQEWARLENTILGESNRTTQGMADVAHVVSNRVQSPKFPNNINKVLTPSQFNALAPRGSLPGAGANSAGWSDAQRKAAREAAMGVFNKTISPTAPGATHYYSPSGMKALVNRGQARSLQPSWAKTMPFAGEAEGHRFYGNFNPPSVSDPNGPFKITPAGYSYAEDPTNPRVTVTPKSGPVAAPPAVKTPAPAPVQQADPLRRLRDHLTPRDVHPPLPAARPQAANLGPSLKDVHPPLPVHRPGQTTLFKNGQGSGTLPSMIPGSAGPKAIQDQWVNPSSPDKPAPQPQVTTGPTNITPNTPSPSMPTPPMGGNAGMMMASAIGKMFKPEQQQQRRALSPASMPSPPPAKALPAVAGLSAGGSSPGGVSGLNPILLELLKRGGLSRG